VAQRRRRVFVVGHLGDWRRAAAVLFERESLRGDPAPSREAEKATAGTIEASINCSRGTPTAAITARMVAFGEYVDDGTASAMKARDYKDATDLVAIPIHDQATRFAGKRGDKQDGKGNGFGVGFPGEPAPTLTKGDKHAVAYSSAVRRLTPTECERLQGFQDGYTNIPWRKAIDSPDGPRYKSLGNSMAVPVMKWIGERIKLQMLTPAS
jgi:DNA (cytosine-5)-methyltransferase 1